MSPQPVKQYKSAFDDEWEAEEETNKEDSVIEGQPGDSAESDTPTSGADSAEETSPGNDGSLSSGVAESTTEPSDTDRTG